MHLPRDDRLGAQALEHKGKRLPGQLEDEGGLPARRVERHPAPSTKQSRGGQCLGHRQALAGVQGVVVDTGC